MAKRSPSPETAFGGPRANPSGGGNATASAVVRSRTGRPASLIREAYRQSLSESLKFLEQIRDAKIYREVEVIRINRRTGKAKKVTLRRYPTITERMKAVEVIGQFSGVERKQTAEDEQPIPPSAPLYNLHELALEELEQLEQLLTKVQRPILQLSDGITEVHTKESNDAVVADDVADESPSAGDHV